MTFFKMCRIASQWTFSSFESSSNHKASPLMNLKGFYWILEVTLAVSLRVLLREWRWRHDAELRLSLRNISITPLCFFKWFQLHLSWLELRSCCTASHHLHSEASHALWMSALSTIRLLLFHFSWQTVEYQRCYFREMIRGEDDGGWVVCPSHNISIVWNQYVTDTQGLGDIGLIHPICFSAVRWYLREMYWCICSEMALKHFF